MIHLLRMAYGLVLSILALGGQAKAALEPILPLEVQDLRIDYWHMMFSDEDLEVQVESDLVAKEVRIDLQDMQRELKKAKGEARTALLRRSYRYHVALVRYLQDIEAGRITSKSYGKQATALLKAYRQGFYQAVAEYVKVASDTKDIAVARYHLHTVRYLDGHHDVVSDMAAIAPKLPPGLRLQLALVIAYHQNRPLSASEVRLLQMASQKLDRTAQAVAYALLARHVAQQRKPAYRDDLAHALSLANRLPRQAELNLFKFAIKTWRVAEPNANWDHVPVATERFEKTMTGLAIRERALLGRIRSGAVDHGLSLYRSLVSDLERGPYMVAIDQRIITIQEAVYSRDQKLEAYEAELKRLMAKYNHSEFSDAAFLSNLERRYSQMTFARLDKAEQPAARLGYAEEAIALGARFVIWTKVYDEQIRVREQFARIYVAKNQHAKAVGVYDHLLQLGPQDQKVAYTQAAIKSQSILARWPLAAPMSAPLQDRAAGRDKLLGYYESLYAEGHETGQNLAWQTLAHMGLLHMNLGNRAKAFDLWQAALAVDGKAEEARYAAAQMLVVHNQEKSWQDLESLTDLCLSREISPHGFLVQELSYYLAEALYHGGRSHYEKRNWRQAWQKMERFNQTFKSDSRRDETAWLVAYAYRGDQKFSEAVNALVQHNIEYTKSPYRVRGQLSGGAWAQDMALEEQVIFFLQTFLNENLAHTESHRVRDVLVNTYLALGHYGDAGRIYKQQALATDLPVKNRILAALAQMELEERYGSREAGEWGAQQALQIAATPDVVATVLAFRARNVLRSSANANANGDADAALKALFDQSASVPTTSRIAQEYIGQIRFYYAETQALRAPEQIFNLGIADHNAVLDEHVYKFMQAKKHYDHVCEAGQTSYCAPSLHKIAEMTKVAIKTLDQVEVPSSWDRTVIKQFTDRKTNVIGHLTKMAVQASEQAYELTKQGMAAPQFARDIVWQNTNDWNFGEASGEVGYTYAQWKTDTKAQ